LLHNKLKEFLDLEHGNHSVFDYTSHFNILAQYGSYHVNTNEKKANMYRERLTIHLQERMGQFTSLSYKELASAAIDEDKLMKVVAKSYEKKRKRMMLGSYISGGSSGAPPSTAWYIPQLGISCTDHNSSRIGAIAHNTKSGSSSHNSSNNNNNSSSTMLPLHLHSRLQSGHNNSLPPVAFCATTVERWDTSPVIASCPSKAIHRELRHPWSINRRANREVLHNGLATPTTPT
jgi:hypothetical protein